MEELKHLSSNELAIKFGILGIGQKGNKDADIFAGFKFKNNEPCYPTLALNLSKTDMMYLDNIPMNNRVHFEGTKGAARTPAIVENLFNAEVNEDAETHQNRLLSKFYETFHDENNEPLIDHLLITVGAGGGVGTGFGLVFLKLFVQSQILPYPVSFLLSLPSIKEKVERQNAIELIEELRKTLKEQDAPYLANVIVADNDHLQTYGESKQGTTMFKQHNLSWQKYTNAYIVSLIHELNLIPTTLGSDYLTYDASDMQKLFLQGGFTSISKSRIANDKFSARELMHKATEDFEDDCLTYRHDFESAKHFASILLRPRENAGLQDSKIENAVREFIETKKNISHMEGKISDPIWNGDFCSLYTIFTGMNTPLQYLEFVDETKKLVELESKQSEEIEVDTSFIKTKETFNPFAKKSATATKANPFATAVKKTASLDGNGPTAQEMLATNRPNPFGKR